MATDRWADACGCYGITVDGKDITGGFCTRHEYGKCWSCGKRTPVSVNTQHENGLLCVSCRVDDRGRSPEEYQAMLRALKNEKQPRGETRIARLKRGG